MARGQGHSLVRYRSNGLLFGRKLEYGRKVISDLGDITYEGWLITDDYGNTYDPRKRIGDTSYDENLRRGA